TQSNIAVEKARRVPVHSPPWYNCRGGFTLPFVDAGVLQRPDGRPPPELQPIQPLCTAWPYWGGRFGLRTAGDTRSQGCGLSRAPARTLVGGLRMEKFRDLPIAGFI
ncbi:unnamed protein product, partial [Ectocarpus sp. 4 AP-2014]